MQPSEFVNQAHNQKILVEQVRLLYRSLLPILAVNLIVGTAMLFGLWEVVSQKALTIWMSLMLFLLGMRVVSYFIYRHKFTSDRAQRYGWYFVIGTAITGLLWGVGAVVLFPEQELEYQLFILFMLVGMGAGSVSSLTTYLPAFYAFFPVSMIPITIKLFLIGESIQLSLGTMTIAYIIALSYFGLNIGRTMKQSLKLRFENIELVELLKQQKEEAEQSNIAKSKFLAAASHDLRQPLHALTLFTSVLNDSSQTPENRNVVNQILASAESLESLFNALLDISRLDAGTLKVRKQSFHLQPLIKRLKNDFEQQAKEKGLKITWPHDDAIIKSDPALFEQILRNFITNAIRYTTEGSIQITINAQEQDVLIRVSDTGVGIANEQQEKIFDEFYQLSNPERDRSKGLGLGLAIVKRTADLLQHRIEVQSEPGKGSVFSIYVEKVEYSHAENDHIFNQSEFSLTKDAGFFVIIDDDRSILAATQKLLQSWGYDMVMAETQDDALQQLKNLSKKPDVIITDYRLPNNCTGIEAIQAIQSEFGNEIPALIITGDTAVEQLREVNDSGYQVLHKPVSPIKLRALLRNLLRQSTRNEISSR